MHFIEPSLFCLHIFDQNGFNWYSHPTPLCGGADTNSTCIPAIWLRTYVSLVYFFHSSRQWDNLSLHNYTLYSQAWAWLLSQLYSHYCYCYCRHESPGAHWILYLLSMFCGLDCARVGSIFWDGNFPLVGIWPQSRPLKWRPSQYWVLWYPWIIVVPLPPTSAEREGT